MQNPPLPSQEEIGETVALTRFSEPGQDEGIYRTGRLKMALFRVAEFNPNYRAAFGGQDLKGLEVCTAEGEKIGTVADALVDETGRFQYLVVDMGFWIFGKQVLLPIGRASLDQPLQRVYVYDLTKSQAENLPTYEEKQFQPESGTIPPSIELPGVPLENQRPVESSAPLELPRVRVLETPLFKSQSLGETPAELEPPIDRTAAIASIEEIDADPFPDEVDSEADRELHRQLQTASPMETQSSNLSDSHLEPSSLETSRETAAFSDPELLGFLNRGDLQGGEVMRVELYAEAADIRKEVVLRESVQVRKQVTTETYQAEAELRREALDVYTEGQPILHSSKNFEP
ncbi:MAG: PRC and DUF2382 domain-containing protein [Leptolyngbyaceae cyanobacterium bins.59]|nr:PRC and DUF2382 domain-containing protein [Leptolyngbyaceae cyanobacterium bins.59]